MKKLMMISITIAALVFSACCLYMVVAHENIIRQGEYDAGFDDGMEYAIENMEVYTCERYDPENPADTLRDDGYEQTIYIDLGGLTYEHALRVN